MKNFYSYTDGPDNISNEEYYRLKAIDKDGNFSYSSIVKIETSIGPWNVQITPNPVVKSINLRINSPLEEKATVIISDLSGRKLSQHTISIHVGKNSFELSSNMNLSKGTYFISIFSKIKTQTIKVILN